VYDRLVDAVMPALQGCFDKAELPLGEYPVTARYTIEPPGYTGGISIKSTAPQAVNDCATAVLQELKFPQYKGTKVTRELAFTYWKRNPSADAGAKPTPVK
jgi:hypothetical protein